MDHLFIINHNSNVYQFTPKMKLNLSPEFGFLPQLIVYLLIFSRTPSKSILTG